MYIAHNIQAMNARRMYGMTTSNRIKTAEMLSSGYRINRAGDDASGLTISEKMRSQIRALKQGAENIQDGISLCQIADGALSEVSDMLHRMTELSVKSANGTNTDDDRQAIQEEVDQIIQEIDRISESTEFNTLSIFGKQKVKNDEGFVITKLVESPGGETKSFSEAYSSAGQYYPSVSLDFSNVDEKNIKQLKDGYFSFKCLEGCGEVFKIKFFDKKGESSSVDGMLDSKSHVYNINLNGITSGSELVDLIRDTVYNNLPSQSDTAYGVNSFGDPIVSHDQAMSAYGSTIVVYDFENGRSNEEEAKNLGAEHKGYADAGTVTKPIIYESENNFRILCSNNIDDEINIQIEYMDSTVLGVYGISVLSDMAAKNSIEMISVAGDKINAMRSDIGAYQNRLEHSYNNNKNIEENTTAAESRIRDTDIASMIVKLSIENILSQVGEAMMAQANESTQGVLALFY